METRNTIIINNNWNTTSDKYIWIRKNDSRYLYIRRELINQVFPLLREEDKDLLLNCVVQVVNCIYLKFGFYNNPAKDDNLLWDQFKQNKLLDFRALLTIILPYISDNEFDDKKHRLRKLSDLYLEMDERGEYKFTNSQYNRCIRFNDKSQTVIIKRPFRKEYLLDHIEMLLMSIETIANKLYINWVDVIPITINKFNKTQLYADTVLKIVGEIITTDDGTLEIVRSAPLTQVELINNYMDPNPGISYQDFYNVMSNHLFHEIHNHRWLIYEIMIRGRSVLYLTYLETMFDLDMIWKGFLWSNLSQSQINKFSYQWKNFLDSSNNDDNTVLSKFYFFFSKYHKNSQKLIRQGKLVLNQIISDDEEEEEEENVRITPEKTRFAKQGMYNIPTDEIYLFFYDQLNAFKKSWFYYITKIKNQSYITTIKQTISNGSKVELYITPKNIYNYCKSMIHYTKNGKFTQIPRHWNTLKPTLVEMVLIRMLDIEHPSNDWSKGNWFNINNNIRRIYPMISDQYLPETNRLIHKTIRTNLVDIVFESLIYHGLLSDFVPNKIITDATNPGFSAAYQWDQMKKQHFTPSKRKDFESNAYYFITGKSYGDLEPLKSKNYPQPNYEKKYFDILTSSYRWPFFYAMNWMSQINFYHHYLNNRVMYITGATGVGKSTQVPKLLMYSQKMLDYNSNGKIICTQPRVPPTVDNANTISRELGVPIKGYNSVYDKDTSTSNYYVQYKHSEGEHMDKNVDSFLKIVTDGTLFEEMKRSPFMTRSKPILDVVDYSRKPIDWVQTYLTGNIYDIIIVDEAHEHNGNMDMILTLARDAAYVNNSIKLVIVSATMDDDEPIYRRYYRPINDNRAYPLSSFIENQRHDRANMDRRIHISPPGATTQYVVRDHYLTQAESDEINGKNFVDYGIKKTIEIVNSTTEGDLLLFLSGQADIHKAVVAINAATPSNVIALGFYSRMSEEMKAFVGKIDANLPNYTRFKDDVLLEEASVERRVPRGTYKRAVVIATNVAEASITITTLRYVIDTGYAKVAIFDPLEGVTKEPILPISQSSSAQRRGRVGRVASGDVYYLYSKEKIINNKTAYKIADENIKEKVIGLLKSDSRDSFIITKTNDINNIDNLRKIMDHQLSKTSNKDAIFDILKNPRPYLDIIRKQYMYIPDLEDMEEYYTYYGKTNELDYPTILSIKKNFEKYLVENHDDYNYQESNVEFYSRGYTGYDSDILSDQNLSFYIIHPDENIIRRNMYTGKMESLKYNPAVPPSYYYYVLNANNIAIGRIYGEDIETNIRSFDFRNINYNNFFLLKYHLAIDEAKLQLLVIKAPGTNIIFRYDDVFDDKIRRNINDYFVDIARSGKLDEITVVRSNILSNLSLIQSMVSLKILNNTNNMLWYAYSMPYGLESEVLALMVLINTVPDISQWISAVKSKGDIIKFFNLHLTKKGDIYFLWTLWNSIKDMLNSKNLFDLTKIDISLMSKFRNYKEKYLKNIKIPFDEYTILDKMYKSGKLNTEDEFYYYLNLFVPDFKDITEKKGVQSYINIIAKNHMLNAEALQTFVSEYFNSQFSINKRLWIYEHEKLNKLNDIDPELDLITWAKKKLSLPGIINDPNYTTTPWDRILETYLRAFSTNLIKNKGRYYLKINNGMRVDPDYWSKRLLIEKTFFSDKTEYIIYHNEESSGDSAMATYLTPVQLQWILNINPIYYYYLFYDKDNALYYMHTDSDVLDSIDVINSSRRLFSKKSLIAYLDTIDNPTISELIRSEINNYQEKN